MALRRPAKEFAPSQPVDLLVVGLGNPGPEWEGSRHNAGADVVRVLAERAGVTLAKTRAPAVAGTGRFGDARLGLAVPLTFMNDSGAAVRGLVKRFGVDLDRLLVVTDDMDLAFGRLRLRSGGGTGGHQGLNSVKNHLHSPDFL